MEFWFVIVVVGLGLCWCYGLGLMFGFCVYLDILALIGLGFVSLQGWFVWIDLVFCCCLWVVLTCGWVLVWVIDLFVLLVFSA